MKTRLLLLSACALAGCATADMHLPAVRVLFTDAEKIKMEWSTLRFNDDAAQAMAVAYCGGRRVEVVDGGQTPEYRNRTWRCL